ncbi:MAG: septum formation family protein [Microthrixaceae bacterium]
MTRPRTRRAVRGVILALAAALGCGVTACGSSTYTPLQVGQCLRADAGVEGRRVDEPPTVPCDEPHRYEVYARADLEPPDDAWPGEELLDANARRLCGLAIPDATGEPIRALPPGVTMLYIAPTESSWRDGDREVECLFRHEESTTATLRRGDA